MIDWFQRAEESLQRLLDTDSQVAELKVKHERDKRKAKRIWSAIFNRTKTDSTCKPLSVEARKSATETHEEYQAAQAAEMTSLLEYEKLLNERDTADLVIRFWQSWNKATNTGQM